MLQNTLHIQNLAYNASTNTPPLSESNRDSVALYEVATAGKLTGVAIQGATVGADSYLLVGDIVQAYNGGYKLLSREVTSGTTITVGTGGLFSTLEVANAYINQRSYVDLTIDILSPLTETITYSLSNNCSGNLLIKGNGHLIDFTGGARLEISGLNIHLSNFKVQASHATEPALYIQSDVEVDTELEVKNTLAGTGLYLESCSLTPKYGSSSTIITSSAGSYGLSGDAYNLVCNTYSGSPIMVGLNSSAFIPNVTANIFGSSNSIGRFGTVTGTVNYGSSTNSAFVFTGAITGNVTTGTNSSSHFGGAITGNVTTGTNSTTYFSFSGSPLLGQVIIGGESRAYFNVQSITSSVAGNVLSTGNNSSVELSATLISCTVAGGTVTIGTGSQFITSAAIGNATNPINITTGKNSSSYFGGAITGNVYVGINSSAYFSGTITGSLNCDKNSNVFISATGVAITHTSGVILTVGDAARVILRGGNLVCTAGPGSISCASNSTLLGWTSVSIGDATYPIDITTGSNSNNYINGNVTGNITTGPNSNNVFGTIDGNLYFSMLSKVKTGNITVPAGGSVDFEQQVNLNLGAATITLGAGVTNTAGKLNVVYHNNWAGVSAAAKTAFNYTAGVLSSAASGSNLSNL